MRSSRTGLLVLAFVSCLPLACKDGGCGGGGNGGAPSASATAAVSVSAGNSASASGSARHRSPGVRASGVGAPLFRAANQLDLPPEQKTAYEKIGTDMREASKADADAGAGPRTAMKEANSALAAGIKAGKIDTAKIEAQQALLDKAAKTRQEREADALNQLYATLTPDQRTKIVASIRSEEEKRAARMKGRDAGAGPNFARMRFEGYTKDLELDAEQQKKVDGILPKDDTKTAAAREEGKKQLEAVLAGFEKEGFDAKKLQPDPKKAIRPLEDLSKFFAQLVPILKPPQREKLAAKLEKANEDHPRPHRGFGRGHDPRLPDAQEEDDDVE